MANTLSVAKRAREAEKRRNHNASRRSNMRTAIKKVVQAVEAKDLEKAQTLFRQATKVLAINANKRLIKKNKAARHTAQLNRLVHSLSPNKSAD